MYFYYYYHCYYHYPHCLPNISMNFNIKYQENKLNYTELKKQYGGNFDLEGWIQVSMPGRYNCGIYINNNHPDKIIKCTIMRQKKDRILIKNTLEKVIELNEEVQFFPLIYDYTIIDGDMYVKMQRLNGSLADFYRKFLPNVVLERLINERKITDNEKINIIKLFEMKKEYTLGSNEFKWQKFKCSEFHVKCLTDNEFFDKAENEIKKINLDVYQDKDISLIIDGKQYSYKKQYGMTLRDDINKISKQFDLISAYVDEMKLDCDYDKYMLFIKELFDEYTWNHQLIVTEILKIRFKLLDYGFYYIDNQYDNYGYILSEHPLDDYRGINVPIIFDKYFYVYFLDWDSGLSQRIEKNDDDYNNAIKVMLEDFNSGFNILTTAPIMFNNVDFSYFDYEIPEQDIYALSNKFRIPENVLRILAVDINYDLSLFITSFDNVEDILAYYVL